MPRRTFSRSLVFTLTLIISGTGFAMEEQDPKEQLYQELEALRTLDPWECTLANVETHEKKCAHLLEAVNLSSYEALYQSAHLKALVRDNHAKLTPMNRKRAVASFVCKTLGYGGATCTLPIACLFLLEQYDFSIEPMPRPLCILAAAWATIGLAAVVSPVDELYSNGLSVLQRIVGVQTNIAQQLDVLREKSKKEKAE